jgi:hypothetical protein
MSACDQVLTRSGPERHVVQFYDDDEALLVTKVGHFLREGWKANESLVLVGTTKRNLAIADELNSLGVDVAAAVNSGRLLFFDAEDLLGRITSNGQPDWDCFDSEVGATVRRLNDGGSGVRAYGEMVGMLWSRGQKEAALQLEAHWNRLIRSSRLALFCAYPIDVLSHDFDQDGVDAVLCAHTHLMPVSASSKLGSAVDRAMRDVLGERAEGLHRAADAHVRPSSAAVPKAEGMIFWLRNNLPQYADRILARARSYYRTA